MIRALLATFKKSKNFNWTAKLDCEKPLARQSQPVFRIEKDELYTVVIEEDGVSLSVTLVCSCELPVQRLGEEEFTCKHCDRACDYKDCDFCRNLGRAFELRFPQNNV